MTVTNLVPLPLVVITLAFISSARHVVHQTLKRPGCASLDDAAAAEVEAIIADRAP